VIVCFVDIGGIDDHHCLNFLFIMINNNNNTIIKIIVLKMLFFFTVYKNSAL
jgi:hypothetical protein